MNVLQHFFQRRWWLIVVAAAAVLLAIWATLRFLLTIIFPTSVDTVRLLDVGFAFIIGIVAIALLSRIIARYVNAYVGATQSNVIRLLFQVVSLSILFLTLFSMSGVNIGNALLGAGFLGIVLGLAAQTVLGNFFAGLMLLASRPFRIGDRVALIIWQYGKFPPSLSHGWMEPSYTGVIKEITLIYTKLLTDANNIVTVPNGVVMQSLILNLSHDKQHGYIAAQLEVPIQVDPEELHKNLNFQLSKMPTFKGKEESFELLEVSPAAYLVALSYRIGPKQERESKTLLLCAFRLALLSTDKNPENNLRTEQ